MFTKKANLLYSDFFAKAVPIDKTTIPIITGAGLWRKWARGGLYQNLFFPLYIQMMALPVEGYLCFPVTTL